MKKVCLLSICLFCGAVYGYEYPCEDKITFLEVKDGALDCNGEDAMHQSGRHVHKKRSRKQVRSKGTAPQSATEETTLKAKDTDSANCSENTVSKPAIEEMTLKVKKGDNLWNRRDNTMLPSTMKVVIGDILDKENFLGHADKIMIRTCLSKAVENHGSENIEMYGRTDIDAITEERSFQQSDHVQESQIKRIGDKAGVDYYILIPEIMKLDDNQILLTAKLVNVTTGKIAGGTPIKRCDMEYNNYCATCQQLVEILLTRLVE